jgi:hypothetical protein
VFLGRFLFLHGCRRVGRVPLGAVRSVRFVDPGGDLGSAIRRVEIGAIDGAGQALRVLHGVHLGLVVEPDCHPAEVAVDALVGHDLRDVVERGLVALPVHASGELVVPAA